MYMMWATFNSSQCFGFCPSSKTSWWLVADDRWLVVGGWWLVAGGLWLVAGGLW